MIAAVADTHTVHWLLYNDHRLSAASREFIDRAVAAEKTIGISLISLVEVLNLAEKNRIPKTAFDILRDVMLDPAEVLVQGGWTGQSSGACR
jgi:PIN domain nuclease of toxin-antitoxin system